MRLAGDPFLALVARAPPGSRLAAAAVALAARGGKPGMAAVLQWWVCVLGQETA